MRYELDVKLADIFSLIKYRYTTNLDYFSAYLLV